MVDKKANEDLIAEIKYEKVSKSDFVDHLPEYLTPEALDNRIKDICDTGISRVMSEFQGMRAAVDKKMVKIRQEFDMTFLRKQIDKKANKNDLDTSLIKQEDHFANLDNNNMLIA